MVLTDVRSNFSVPRFISSFRDETYMPVEVDDDVGSFPTTGHLGISGDVSSETTDPVMEEDRNLLAIILIALIAITLILVTIIGNLLVLLSFALNRQLRILTNYFLLSLAVADCCIGFISMPLYTIFILVGRWPFGGVICDLWLTVDYVLCNASVWNLLVICCDRYLSLTRPLTYRASRTPKKVFLMIAGAWVLSILIWSPWIFGWSSIEGKRTVPPDDCYIQFLEGNKLTSRLISLALTFIAFYGPVAAMCILYFKVYGITRQRTIELKMLQANKRPGAYAQRHNVINKYPEKAKNKRTVSDSNTNRRFPPPRISHSMMSVPIDPPKVEPKSKSIINVGYEAPLVPSSSTDSTSKDTPSAIFDNGVFSTMRSIDSPLSGEEETASSSDSTGTKNVQLRKKESKPTEVKNSQSAVLSRLSLYLRDDSVLKTMAPVITALRNSDVTTISGEPQLLAQAPMGRSKTALTPISRIVATGWLSLINSNLRRQQTAPIPSRVVFDEDGLEPVQFQTFDEGAASSGQLSPKQSCLGKTLHCGALHKHRNKKEDNQQSPSHEKVTMAAVSLPLYIERSQDGRAASSNSRAATAENSIQSCEDETVLADIFPESEIRRQSMFAQFKQWSAKAFLHRGQQQGQNSSSRSHNTPDSDSYITSERSRHSKHTQRRTHDDRAAEKKAAKMLTAILLVFILTWLPYTFLTNIQSFCFDCVPQTLYQMSYWLCYINSTLNPLCYAFCNATFRNTFIDILQCKYCCQKQSRSRRAYYDQCRPVGYRGSVRTDSSGDGPGTTTGVLRQTTRGGASTVGSPTRKTNSNVDFEPPKKRGPNRTPVSKAVSTHSNIEIMV